MIDRSAHPIYGHCETTVATTLQAWPSHTLPTTYPHHLVSFTRPGLTRVAGRADLQIRDLWFDRLARERMDGHPFVTGTTALLLALENVLGNGLFVNLLLEAA